MRVEIYSEQYKDEWNNFVANSKNGTFLFHRDFMEYHKARFNDFSLLFYKKNKLIALLPGNLKDQVFYSHQGLTYGGLIMNGDTTTVQVLEIFEHFVTSLRQQGVKEIIYKAIPHIYHAMPAEEDLYALFVNKAQITARGISSVLALKEKQNYSLLRKRGIKKAHDNKINIKETDDLDLFWPILEKNLKERHNTKPVHSIEEIELLKKQFTPNIRFFGAYKNGELLAGTILFITDEVIHLQYIAASANGKALGATDILVDHVIQNAWTTQKHFDYGISTENNGQILNTGLISHKEGFGARAITYDIYSIKLS